MKTKKRFGIILVNKNTSQLYVVRRINYVLWNRINNINLTTKDNLTKMLFVMYPGVDVFLEFPKGVKEKYETGYECALREFYEETRIFIDPNSEILSEIQQQYIGGDGKNYSVVYYVINSDIRVSRDTVVRNIENPPVLSDSFNVLVFTKWFYIRHFFEALNHTIITSNLDKIFNFQESVNMF